MSTGTRSLTLAATAILTKGLKRMNLMEKKDFDLTVNIPCVMAGKAGNTYQNDSKPKLYRDPDPFSTSRARVA